MNLGEESTVKCYLNYEIKIRTKLKQLRFGLFQCEKFVSFFYHLQKLNKIQAA